MVNNHKKTLFTLAKRYIMPANDYSAFPGSLEEELNNTPESFFKSYSEQLPAISKNKSSDEAWKNLQHTEINSYVDHWANNRHQHKPQSKNVDITSVRFTVDKNSKNIPNMETIKGKNPNLIPITDEDLLIKYKGIKKKVKDWASNSTFPKKIEIVDEARQERSFNHYEETKEIWDKNMKGYSKKVGREPALSVMSRQENYREKIEAGTTFEQLNPVVKIEESKWMLTLRSSPFGNERRNCSVPIGNSYSKLWMQVKTNQANPLEFVRKPKRLKGRFKAFRDYPSYKEKIRKEYKKISELIGGISTHEENFDNFEVEGTNILKSEIKAVKTNKQPKEYDPTKFDQEPEEI